MQMTMKHSRQKWDEQGCVIYNHACHPVSIFECACKSILSDSNVNVLNKNNLLGDCNDNEGSDFLSPLLQLLDRLLHDML